MWLFYQRSCWSYAAISALESAHHAKTKQSVILSEQQLIDCSHNCDKGGRLCNKGCNGGKAILAYDYMLVKGGVELNKDYKVFFCFSILFWYAFLSKVNLFLFILSRWMKSVILKKKTWQLKYPNMLNHHLIVQRWAMKSGLRMSLAI